jgi:GNAT superfamily N-acetyltransferase
MWGRARADRIGAMPSHPAPDAPSSSPPALLRPAELRDVQPIVGLIRELAEFEQLSHLLQVTPEKLRPHLFGEKTVAEAMVAEVGGEVVAFALYFTNFSTFLAQPGLYLEDLYVQPAHRGKGIGEALLTRLGKLAAERNYGRFEWSVLDWNENAIRFYERMGATVMPDWRVCRIAGDALAAFAQR